MRYLPLLLVGTISIHAALADRGTATRIAPTECNIEPTITAPVPTPNCIHAADPDGARGLCPDLSSDGWCDCGSDGYFPILPGSGICDYSSLDPDAAIILSTTDCATPTTAAALTSIANVTVVHVAEQTEPVSKGPAARRGASRLKKRAGQSSYAESCNAAPPSGSSYNAGTGFATMKSVLEQAIKDAFTLANHAQSVASDNKGFTHYFGGAQADSQLAHFQNMMAGIARLDNNFAIQFECSNTPDCADNSVLVTDATPGSASDVKSVQVCPKFWTAASTKYFIYDSTKTSPSPPYRNNDNSLSGWCRKSTAGAKTDVSARTNQYFATAGGSVLHELTHLDSLAQLAGLDASEAEGDNGAHGTDDVQTECELVGARRFLVDYVGGLTQGTSPDYNAESYAAAATEIYFMDLCGFSEIRPLV